MPPGPFCAPYDSSDSGTFRPRSNSISSKGGRSSWPRVEVSNQPSAPSSPTHSFYSLPTAFEHFQRDASPSSSRKSSYSSSDDSTSPSGGTPGTSTGGSTCSKSTSSLGLNLNRKLWEDQETGEDPQLKAARRALWDDVIIGQEQDKPKRIFESSTSSLGSTSSNQTLKEDISSPQNARPPLTPFSDANKDGTDVNEESSDEDDVDEVILPPVPCPSQPSHTTLPPLSSCLRTSPPARPHSSLSTSSSTSLCLSSYSHSSSVHFSPEPPGEAVTYSSLDYERRGHAPVEKLTMKEWAELKGVREAVGVWSGKIKPPSVDDDISATSAKEKENTIPSPTSLSNSWLSLGAHGDEDDSDIKAPRRKTSCRSFGAFAGVVTVGGAAARRSNSS